VAENSSDLNSESGKAPLIGVIFSLVIGANLRGDPAVSVAGLDRMKGAACNLSLRSLDDRERTVGISLPLLANEADTGIFALKPC
jgi:hypothetical protein